MMELDEMIVWAISPLGMIVVGLIVGLFAALEIWLILRATRRRR